MMTYLFWFCECIYNRHVERRGQYGVEHLRHPGIVLHLNLSIGSVGCLGVFLIFRMHKTYRRWIFHLPSLGYMMWITYHRRHMPHRTLHSAARPLKIVFAPTYGKSGEERGVASVGIIEIISRSHCHIAHLHRLVPWRIPPPGIHEGCLGGDVPRQGDFHRCIYKCQQVVEQVGLYPKEGAGLGRTNDSILSKDGWHFFSWLGYLNFCRVDAFNDILHGDRCLHYAYTILSSVEQQGDFGISQWWIYRTTYLAKPMICGYLFWLVFHRCGNIPE